MRNDKPLFSVTLADCTVQTFTVGGNGGAGKDTSNTGVRVIHSPSGAVGEARDERSQLQNKRLAFKRMANTKVFKLWCRRKAMNLKDIDSVVEDWMDKKFLRTEGKNAEGRWEEIRDAE